MKVGTFDTNPDAAQAVQDGKIQCLIDQQPYLQGYLAITQLYLFKKNGNVLGGGQAVLTGPSFVDKTNIDPGPPVHQAEHPLTGPRRGSARRRSVRPPGPRRTAPELS